jgi:hypothetical protein
MVQSTIRMHDLQGVSPLTPLALGQSRIEMYDVGPLIDQLPGGSSPLARTVHRVNLALSTIREPWRNACAIELAVTMDQCNESIEAMMEQLESPRLREHARLEAINLLRSAPHDGPTAARELADEGSVEDAVSLPRPIEPGDLHRTGSWQITEESVLNFPSALSFQTRCHNLGQFLQVPVLHVCHGKD